MSSRDDLAVLSLAALALLACFFFNSENRLAVEAFKAGERCEVWYYPEMPGRPFALEISLESFFGVEFPVKRLISDREGYTELCLPEDLKPERVKLAFFD